MKDDVGEFNREAQVVDPAINSRKDGIKSTLNEIFAKQNLVSWCVNEGNWSASRNRANLRHWLFP